ncbi:hypothetical protein NC653_039100 [Populus alba x Populus x berolinensis]|uniref:Uncharacterized protein n=1 Tax=Populus alba x Populus x berolinensis TaxID=444605 RepID=A0AAD6PQ42_9ROSI|nr:hypothetical protein NC653_039100 [Populus alba x Populus x berolinensis]
MDSQLIYHGRDKSRYSNRFLIRLEKRSCVVKPKKFPNVVFYLSLHSLDDKHTTSCLLYHGRVIPKSMSTVIVLDDDLRAFNCFREQMVAMIHGVFNNSRVVCQGNSLPFTLANLAGPINLTRKLNLSHMIKVGEIQMLAKPIYVLCGRKIFGQTEQAELSSRVESPGEFLKEPEYEVDDEEYRASCLLVKTSSPDAYFLVSVFL